GPVDVGAGLARALLEAHQQLVEMVERVGLERGGAHAQLLPVGHLGRRGVAAPAQIPDRGVVVRELAARGQVGARASVEGLRHTGAPLARISARWIARGPKPSRRRRPSRWSRQETSLLVTYSAPASAKARSRARPMRADSVGCVTEN